MSLWDIRWHKIWAYLSSPEPSFSDKNETGSQKILIWKGPTRTIILKVLYTWDFGTLRTLELSRLRILYTISWLFWRTLVIYSRKKPSDRVRNKTYLEFHKQNLKQLFTSGSPEGMWVEQTGNILKHASTSQHVHMLGVTKFKIIVSLPNSPLFQVSNLKIQVFQRIKYGAYSKA